MKYVTLMLATLAFFGAGCATEKLDVQQAVDQAKDAVQHAVQQATERGAEEVVKQRIGADVDFDVSQGGATFTDPLSGKTIAVGVDIVIPADFPKDIPLYPDSIATSLSFDPNAADASLLLITHEGRVAIREWYAGAAPSEGWTEEGVLETGDRVILSYVKTGAKLTVTIMPPNLQQETGILLLRNGE